VLVDGGGVLVLPNRRLVAAALASAGVEIDPSLVPRAHYRAARALDRSPGEGYFPTLCRALKVPRELESDAMRALARAGDRRSSGEILWSEPAPGAIQTLNALDLARVPVVVVTNSDGHGAENLRDAGICATVPGAGALISDVVDSAVVGHAKPDPAIFRIALARAGLARGSAGVALESAVHVGDMVSWDVAGAAAAGIAAIHLDPYRACRATDHRHIRALSGIWRHVRASGRPPAG
jgi:FMN phosphatase YigB (HAD superfamily)